MDGYSYLNATWLNLGGVLPKFRPVLKLIIIPFQTLYHQQMNAELLINFLLFLCVSSVFRKSELELDEMYG